MNTEHTTTHSVYVLNACTGFVHRYTFALPDGWQVEDVADELEELGHSSSCADFIVLDADAEVHDHSGTYHIVRRTNHHTV